MTIQVTDINIIHKLPSHAAARCMAVIVRLNNRKTRNDLYAKNAPLNTHNSPFRGVFIQEDDPATLQVVEVREGSR